MRHAANREGEVSARGVELEGLIRRAAQAYRKDGRAVLVQQFPRTATGPGGSIIYAGCAPVDFLGAIGDSAAAVEAKEIDRKSFPLALLPEDQRASMDALMEYGYDCRLIVWLRAVDEIYSVDWEHVAGFIQAPWRKSLSLTWLRAYGQLVPVGDDGSRKALFLDGAAHPDSERCLLHVWHERDTKPVVALDGEDDPIDLDEPAVATPSEYAGLSAEQVRARLMEAMAEGIDRQVKAKTRERKWARRRA